MQTHTQDCCTSQPCSLDAPSTPWSAIDSDILQDESASIVIVGGGPHALALLAALRGLHEGSSTHADGDAVCVIDPGSHCMQSWNSRFDSLAISHLRSPAFAHPVAFEPTALLDFAVREGRTADLIDAPVHSEVSSWLPTTDLSAQVRAARPQHSIRHDSITPSRSPSPSPSPGLAAQSSAVASSLPGLLFLP
jgi:hypothetical protein